MPSTRSLEFEINFSSEKKKRERKKILQKERNQNITMAAATTKSQGGKRMIDLEYISFRKVDNGREETLAVREVGEGFLS